MNSRCFAFNKVLLLLTCNRSAHVFEFIKSSSVTPFNHFLSKIFPIYRHSSTLSLSFFFIFVRILLLQSISSMISLLTFYFSTLISPTLRLLFLFYFSYEEDCQLSCEACEVIAANVSSWFRKCIAVLRQILILIAIICRSWQIILHEILISVNLALEKRWFNL